VIEDATTYRAKDRVLFDLAKALHFSPEALEANRQGHLSAEQARHFSGLFFRPALLTVVWAAAPFLLWPALIAMRQQVSYLSAFPLLFSQLTHLSDLVETQGRFGAIALAGSFLVFLGIAAYTASRISLLLFVDVLACKVEVLEGRVVAREEQTMRSNGRDPIEKYFFSLKNRDFSVSLAAFRAIENGSVYLVYVLPQSGTLASMEPKVGN